MSRFTILLAGPVRASDALRARLRGARTIAADAGIRHAAALGLSVELWVGDFDSADPSGVDPEIARLRFSPDKDETDGEIAIRLAVERGARELLLVGAMGGRTDHVFSHLVLALREAAAGRRVELLDGRERAYPLSGGDVLEVDAQAGAAFSLLRFGDVEGLTIENARYPLADVSLPFHSILTQSNEAFGRLRVGLRSGRAILLVQDDDFGDDLERDAASR